MVDEQQRVAWFRAHHELMDELTGRVRPRRSARTWLPTVLVGALFLGLLVWSWSSEDLARSDRTPLWVFPVRFGVLGAGLVLLALAILLGSRRAGSLGAPRYSWAASPRWAARRRMVALVRSADPGDPEQVGWAADLAGRLAAQRWSALMYAAMALVMLSLGLGASTAAMLLTALLVMSLHLGVLALSVVQDRVARDFIRRHGQPEMVPAR
jgi:hypothetical protein